MFCYLTKLPANTHVLQGDQLHSFRLRLAAGEEADNEIQGSPPQSAVENPFDQQSTQLILTVEQQVRQRLLGRQAGQSASIAASPGHHASIAQLKQAELRIQQLQR